MLDPWAAGWDLWVAIWLGFEPLGSKMLMILDNLPMRRFFFENFRQISAVFVGSIGWRDGFFWTLGGQTPHVGVTSVGPKVVLVLGPSLNKIK